MGWVLPALGFALTAAGSYKASQDAQKDARARQRRQRELFANQDRFSKRTQEKLLSNLNRFSSEENAQRKNEASQEALDTIKKVALASKSTRRGEPNLGIAGKVSSASRRKSEKQRVREEMDNQERNRVLANFLGLSGGEVKTGREFSTLNQALNQIRRDAKGQLAVDQARVAHSPRSNPLFANLLKAGGTALGFAAMANAASEAVKEAAKEAAKKSAEEGIKSAASSSGNWLGQTGGSATQGFAPPVAGKVSSTPTMFNYGPNSFSNLTGKPPLPQFGARWFEQAPLFDQWGNLIPRPPL